tara:strand:- start:84 stop:650 length:567 start_codon:yes stop_codon:yes gene_type:complete
MKITTQQIRQLIKEELQKAMKEKEALNEGPVMLAAQLLSGMGELESPNGTGLPDNMVSVLQTIYDSGSKGEKAVEFIASYAQNGLFSDADGDGKIDIKTPYPDYNEVLDQFAGSVLDTDSSPKAGSQVMKGGNIEMQLAQMQTALDTQNPDNAVQVAKTILQHPKFKDLNSQQQEMVKSTAGLANLAR